MKFAWLFPAVLLASAAASAQSDCDGLVPTDLSNSFALSVPAGTTGGAPNACSFSTTDQAGDILAESSGGNFSNDVTWHAFAPDGTPQATFTANVNVVPNSAGYTVVQRDDTVRQNQSLQTYDGSGNQTSSTAVSGVACTTSLSPSSAGGSLTVVTCGGWGPQGPVTFTRWDENGTAVGSAVLNSGNAWARAVGDEYGNNLVVFWPGTQFGFSNYDYVGVWYDDFGAALTDPFVVYSNTDYPPPANDDVILRSLIGGGAAIQHRNVWVAAVDSGAPSVHPAPQFLTDHPGWDFRVVRGRQAYALTSNGSYSNVMPIYSAAGNRCGSVEFPGYRLAMVGADGTVIASVLGGRGCDKGVWPRLLAAP